MLTFLVPLLQAAAVQPELPRQWAQFSRSGALSHISEKVDIATGDRGAEEDFRYILRLTKKSLDGNPQIAWADSATCPAVRSIISNMRDLKMPSPAPYGLKDQLRPLTVDGTGYSLTAPSSDRMGKLTISSNIGSPLASWIDASFEQLKPCWKPISI